MNFSSKSDSQPFDEFDTHSIVEPQEGKLQSQYQYLVQHYDFRHNVVLSRKEYRLSRHVPDKKIVQKSDWQILTDSDINTIRKDLITNDLQLSEKDLMTYIDSKDVTKRYNPLLDYFNQLDSWGGGDDYIKQLAETCKTDNDELFYVVLKRFLVASVECLLNEDAVNDICLIMQGAQGIGKSRWLRHMLPNQFMRDYYYEGPIDTGKNDHVEYLSKCWLINLEELEVMNKNSINSIKSFITRQRINFRRAYGKFTEDYIRRASFVGSVNDTTFLTDMTGNRRWLVFKFYEINHTHNLDIDKIWSQAYALYLANYRSWFNLKEIKEINERNEQFRNQSYEEELILRYFTFPQNEQDGVWQSSSDIIDYLSGQAKSQASKFNARSIGRILGKNSKDKKRSGGMTMFLVKYLIDKEENNDLYSEPKIKKHQSDNSNDDIDDDFPF
jgi:predicted P-loop ATPase